MIILPLLLTRAQGFFHWYPGSYWPPARDYQDFKAEAEDKTTLKGAEEIEVSVIHK